MNILIVAEHARQTPKKYSIELAGCAHELAKAVKGEVTAVLLGENVEKIAQEFGHYGVSKVITASHPAFNNYSSEAYTDALCKIISSEKPNIVLGTASSMGKDLFARVAARLKVGLATDCTEVRIENGSLIVRRPIYAGKALIDVVLKGTPQMATIRPNTYPIPDPHSNSPQVVRAEVVPVTPLAQLKEIIEAESGMVDLTEADRIVSGGRAIGSKENFEIIRELAKTINASVGASRAAVDAGYISHDHQVGQTGKTVNPSLYIACGISGSIQHLAGMRTSKIIVAINKDAEAPIFSKADYGIVGDLFKIVPLLTEKFKQLLKE